MAKFYRGKRVSDAHYVVLNAYERRYGVPVQLNQGRRTIAEQTRFWLHFLRFGSPVAARPWPGAPHIKFNMPHHALDINAGSGRGQSQHVAAFYRSHGVQVAFNVQNEPWHMDVLSASALTAAAKKLRGPKILKRGSKGPEVVRLKKLLYKHGVRNFSGKHSSNRYNPFFGYYTKKAVQRFQRRNDLVPDGKVGPATWKKLKK